MPAAGERSPDHQEEIERLKERLRDQDERLEATTRLLSSIRILEPSAPPSPAPTPSGRTLHLAILGGAAVLVILAGFLYLRAQSIHPAENQLAVLAQPQLAANPPAPTHPLTQAQPAPVQPAQVAVPPVSAPSKPPQPPTAQVPVTEAKAEPPPLPLPAAEQGPPPELRPPDNVPPPEAAPAERHALVEKPALDNELSGSLNDYLHSHHLPYVEAKVYARAGTPSSLSLSGEVRTEKGKMDAETKSLDFLGNQNIKVHSHVLIDSALASNSPAAGSADAAAPMAGNALPPVVAGNSCTDLCQKDEAHCKVYCQDQTGTSASGIGGSVMSLLNQLGAAGAQARDCNENCVQTEEHCAFSCNSPGPSQQSNGPSDNGAGDQAPSGPDQPPG